MKRGSFDYKVNELEKVIVCHWYDGIMLDICSNATGIAPVRAHGQAH